MVEVIQITDLWPALGNTDINSTAGEKIQRTQNTIPDNVQEEAYGHRIGGAVHVAGERVTGLAAGHMLRLEGHGCQRCRREVCSFTRTVGTNMQGSSTPPQSASSDVFTVPTSSSWRCHIHCCHSKPSTCPATLRLCFVLSSGSLVLPNPLPSSILLELICYMNKVITFCANCMMQLGFKLAGCHSGFRHGVRLSGCS